MPPGSARAASPGRRRARPPATSRCCARPAGTVLQHGGLPPPIPLAGSGRPVLSLTGACGLPRPGVPGALGVLRTSMGGSRRPCPLALPGRPALARVGPGRLPRPGVARCPVRYCAPAWGAPAPHSPWPGRPPSAVPDRGLRPATSPCSWGPALPRGGLPPPSPVPGPGRPASCRARPPSPVRRDSSRLPATTRCCRRPGSAGLARPASPGLRPSPVPVRPARSRCSAGPGRTGRARLPASLALARLAGLLAPAGSAHTDRVRTGPGRAGLPSARFPVGTAGWPDPNPPGRTARPVLARVGRCL